MAHLWTPGSGAETWVATPLAGDSAAFGLRRSGGEPECWVAIGPPAVHVNGVALDVGIRVLRDRDELRVGDARAYYSSESLPVVVAFPGAERPVFCPRCQQEIPPQSAAVRCPACGVWHHQTDELPCWTYAEHCALCDQPTALDGGFRWSPEEVGP
jgi:hypothetical protein